MTVKELKEVLEACEDNAVVYVEDSAQGVFILRAGNIVQNFEPDGLVEVVIDVTRYEVTK